MGEGGARPPLALLERGDVLDGVGHDRVRGRYPRLLRVPQRSHVVLLDVAIGA